MSTKNTVSRELNVESEVIGRRIYIIRSQKVVLSTHLAELYGVKPRTLIQAVKRKASRFPSDFMFKLTKYEFEHSSRPSSARLLASPPTSCSN